MIAFLRNLIFEDFWLKLFSLALAVLIWLTVTFASQKEVWTDKRVFSSIPVTVFSSADDMHAFKVSPTEVAVTVQGDPGLMQNLQSRDIRALVDLTGVKVGGDLLRPVDVAVPAGVTFLQVTPDEVQVIFPPEQ